MATVTGAGGWFSERFPALESSDYRALWFAAGFSAISLWAMITARAWLAHEVAGTGAAVGGVTFATMAPWVLSPFSGAFADRFDRARVVIAAQGVNLLLALGLAVLAFAGVIELWHLILFAALSGVVRSVEMPAQAALLPNTVTAAALLSGITLASMAQFGSRLVGPIAGPVLSGAGPGWVFVMSAVFLAISMYGLSRVRVRSTGSARPEAATNLISETARQIREGVAYLGRAPSVRMVIVLVAVHCSLTMSFDALLVVLASDTFHGGSSEYGGLLMGVGGGALVATVILATIRSATLRGRLFLFSGLASGASVVLVGIAPTFALAVAGTALAGATQAVFMALSAVFVQSVVPDGIRGRVMSLYAMSAGGVMSAMIFANGTASDVISVRILLVVPSVAFVVLLIAWVAAAPDLRRILRSGDLRTPAEIAAGAPAGGA